MRKRELIIIEKKRGWDTSIVTSQEKITKCLVHICKLHSASLVTRVIQIKTTIDLTTHPGKCLKIEKQKTAEDPKCW